MRTNISALLVGVALVGFVTHAQAQCSATDQIAPNPNLGTIVLNSDTACNGENPYDNLGVLNNNGTLTNGSEGYVNPATLNNYGTLNSGRIAYPLPELRGDLNNYGTLNNDGTLTTGNVGRLFNYGVLNNNGVLNYRIEVYALVNAGRLNNYGRLTSNYTLANSGTVYNEGQLSTLSDSISSSGVFINQGSLQSLGFFNSGVFRNYGSYHDISVFRQTAGTIINDGSMYVDAIVDISGGTLQGTGTITVGGLPPGPPYPPSGFLVNGGTIAPGNSTGTLTIDSILTFNSGTLLTEIAGTGAGQFDVLAITGQASFLSGVFVFSFLDDFLPNLGDRWEFLTAGGGLTGWENLNTSFSGIPSSYDFDVTAEDNGLWLSVAAVPEPEIYAMMAVGLGLLGWVGRRKRFTG